jgi:hypothetical protein
MAFILSIFMEPNKHWLVHNILYQPYAISTNSIYLMFYWKAIHGKTWHMHFLNQNEVCIIGFHGI